MDCVSVITASLLSFFGGVVDTALGFLRSLGAERIRNLLNLDKNADALKEEMRELKEERDDVENKVWNLERQPGMRRTQRVSGWLDRVDTLQGEVRSILEDSLAGRLTIWESCSIDTLHSGCLLGGLVADMLERIRTLKGQRAAILDSCLVEEAQPDPVLAVPSKSACIVGGEKILSQIRSYLEDEKKGIIGISGMGGIGKTTLLTEINNQFLTMQRNDFDVVIWVTISSQINVQKIQEDIGVRLGFPRRGGDAGSTRRPLPENEGDRRDTLYRALDQKRFLLLLDDMWEKLELEKIGIPYPNIQRKDGKKIVFTTRSEEVCADMGGQKAKIKLGFLDGKESWTLFREKMDPSVDLDGNPRIKSLAEIVVRKCGGLPLALITMGRAMSNATWEGEWRQAVEKLKEAPDKIRGMEDVLSLLKFSFDRLDDDITRQCLLYCALFPEDDNIFIEGLIEYWVGEGFLDAHSSNSVCLLEARDRGVCVIRKLTDACLLESVNEDRAVKMHDVVREMALWLTGPESDRADRFVVCGGEKGLAQLVEAEKWEGLSRISIMHDGTPPPLPSLTSPRSNLTTFLTMWNKRQGRRNNQRCVITENFCKSMPALRVLDLSGVDMEVLPGGIGLLTELRYLNLSGTRIRQLPKELGNLVKLRQLNLIRTDCLSHIPREAMLTLTGLQSLEMNQSAYRWKDEGDDDNSGGAKLSDVGCHLVRLEELSVDIHTSSGLDSLANSSKKLQKCELSVVLMKVADLTSPDLCVALDKLERLRRLEIRECPTLEVWKVVDCNSQLGSLESLSLFHLEQLKEIVVEMESKGEFLRGHGGSLPPCPLFPSLLELKIWLCGRLKNLRWIGQLPQLKSLELRCCDGLKELEVGEGLSGGEADGGSLPPCPLFPSLLKLEIWDCHLLKNLRWIGQLPHLQSLHLFTCMRLEELLVGEGLSGGEADDEDDHGLSFPKLKTMQLAGLLELKGICERPLLFPSLERLLVYYCPQLKRLPLGQRSCEKIKEIEGEQAWWDALEWGDYDPDSQSSRIKSRLAPFFHRRAP